MSSSSNVIQIKVTLTETNPVIWRQILVPATISFFNLHHIIQISMGWKNYHLFEFAIGDYRIGFIDDEPEDSDSIADSKKVTIDLLLTKEKFVFKYIYDFGDSWVHSVEVEKIDEEIRDKIYPVCIDGNFNCPPEDCGGIPGYYNLLNILRNKNDPEYKDMKNWVGRRYDPEKLNLNNINKELPKFREYDKDWEK